MAHLAHESICLFRRTALHVLCQPPIDYLANQLLQGLMEVRRDTYRQSKPSVFVSEVLHVACTLAARPGGDWILLQQSLQSTGIAKRHADVLSQPGRAAGRFCKSLSQPADLDLTWERVLVQHG